MCVCLQATVPQQQQQQQQRQVQSPASALSRHSSPSIAASTSKAGGALPGSVASTQWGREGLRLTRKESSQKIPQARAAAEDGAAQQQSTSARAIDFSNAWGLDVRLC